MATRVVKRPCSLLPPSPAIQCLKPRCSVRRISSTSSESSSRINPRRSPRNATRVFSGIQPSGIPHLGNYLGALRQWRELQDTLPRHSCTFCIVDLHALTSLTQKTAGTMQQLRRNTLAALLAMGIDGKKSSIYYQSDIPAHSELMWILSCTASMGYLSRMTQWKTKMSLDLDASITSSSQGKSLKLGLFSYPVLQAADILIHKATLVPVGEDQRQHVEFARELANSFNYLYGSVFPLPEARVSPAKRVMSLLDPSKKMSKSDPLLGSTINIDDSKEEIFNKIKRARTDSIEGISYDPTIRPGVSNLIEILVHLQPDGGPTCEETAEDMKDMSLGALKDLVATRIDAELAPIRENLARLLGDEKALEQAENDGRSRASGRTGYVLQRVREAVGLSPPSRPILKAGIQIP